MKKEISISIVFLILFILVLLSVNAGLENITGEATRVFNVSATLANSEPVASGATVDASAVDDAYVNVSQNITLRVNATDQNDGDSGTFRVRTSDGWDAGTLKCQNTTAQTMDDTNPKNFSCEYNATDADGHTTALYLLVYDATEASDDGATVTPTINHAPNAGTAAVNDSAIGATGSVNCTPSDFSDVDSGTYDLYPNKYLFRFWGSGIDTGFTSTSSYDCGGDAACGEGDVINCTIRARDGHLFYDSGSERSLTANITVGNEAPTVAIIDASVTTITLDPRTTALTTRVTINFTATDADTYSDIDTASAYVNYSLDAVTLLNDTCDTYGESGNDISFNCTTYFNYYNLEGSWAINATISDNNGENASDSDNTVTVNVLDAITMNSTSIAFGTIESGTNDTRGSALNLTNDGNEDYDNLTIKAYNLTGTSSQNMSPTVIEVSVTDSANSGTQFGLTEGVEFEIETGSFSLPVATTSVTSDELIYHFIDVPGGLVPQTFRPLTNYTYELSLNE